MQVRTNSILLYFIFKKPLHKSCPVHQRNEILNAPNPAFLRQKKVYYITNLMIAKGEAYQKKYVWSGERRFSE